MDKVNLKLWLVLIAISIICLYGTKSIIYSLEMKKINNRLIKQNERLIERLKTRSDSLKLLKKEDKKSVVKHSDSIVEVSGALVKKITERKPVRVRDTTYNAMCEYLNEYKFKN